ncbi:MAG: DNA replication/repair protein RecF [Thermoflavifilum sp.]|uniref:DNA replication/repair protein RecF n=1 Tax=Thermoflavifilum sp. TaxID=1968839 RepID=UPI0018A4D627|nr:DNA replication/repair protein RecF [Thermoflavifilum sp.]QOR75484.1 MAG: DNA replication/repair protein RecF [Thermoflavifilum sp.]
MEILRRLYLYRIMHGPSSYIVAVEMVQFKNFTQAAFAFSPGINLIVGPNGAGKTNLLDAVHYLSMTKSYFSATDQPLIQYGKEGFRLEGKWYQHEAEHQLVCVVREGTKKEFRVNDIPYPRLAAHIGRFPVVMIAPDDVQMITGGSEERRKWLDMLLSQLSGDYLLHLVAYHKILSQRNQLLRRWVEQPSSHVHDLLDTYDKQWIPHAEAIFQYRQQICAQLIPLTTQFYIHLSGNKEHIQLQYQSQLHEKPFAEWLREQRKLDLQIGRSSVGIHKDDLQFLLNGYPVKIHGSQGQRKSFLLALKFAQHQLIVKQKGIIPVLMLDDIFDRLDPKRIQLLLSLIRLEGFGQVLITDTDPERLTAHLPPSSTSVNWIQLTYPLQGA